MCQALLVQTDRGSCWLSFRTLRFNGLKNVDRKTIPGTSPNSGSSYRGCTVTLVVVGKFGSAQLHSCVLTRKLTFSDRSRTSTKAVEPDPNGPLKRTLVIVVLLLLAFTTLVVVLTRVGRGVANDDPFLDPLANPNIRVQQGTSTIG